MEPEWTEQKLADLARIEIGGTPSRHVISYWAREGGYPWLSIADLSTKWVDRTAERITDAGVRYSNVKLIPAGTPVMSFKLSIGRVALLRRDMYSNEAIAAFHVDGGRVNPTWLYYELPRAASRAITDTAVKGATLNKAKLSELTLKLPSIAEQRRIAEILDTLDEAIRKTEQIIAKLKQVKQGLLYDLLTRGIDDNGELRDPIRHPEQFTTNPILGAIPCAWRVLRFGELCESSAFGPRFPSGRYSADGPLATLRTTDMNDEGEINVATMPRAAIEPTHFEQHLLRVDDLVISRSGTCGIAGVFPGHNVPVVPGAFLIRFRLRSSFLAHFYRKYFNSPLGRPRLERLAVGGVQKNIKGTDVLSLLVPCLPADEARALVAILKSSDHQISSEMVTLAKLRLVKHGLMEDLLTGRVRVTSRPDEDRSQSKNPMSQLGLPL